MELYEVIDRLGVSHTIEASDFTWDEHSQTALFSGEGGKTVALASQPVLVQFLPQSERGVEP